LKALVYFLVPLVVWIVWIVFKTDISYLPEWATQFILFLVQGPSGVQNEILNLGLYDRILLNNSKWSPYYRFVFYALFAGAIALTMQIARTKKIKENIVVISLLFSSFFYFFWLLFFSPVMWPRHSQPGMYFSLCAAILFLAEKLFYLGQALQRKIAYTALGLLTILTLALNINNTSISKVLFSEKYTRPHFLGYKYLFRNTNVYSKKYHENQMHYKKASAYSCQQLFGMDFTVYTTRLNEINLTKGICLGTKNPRQMPISFKEDEKELILKGYNFIAPETVPTKDINAYVRISYDLLENGQLVTSSEYDLRVIIRYDSNMKLEDCQFMNRAELTNLMIQTTQNVFDICL
jgi:hypothetical protein